MKHFAILMFVVIAVGVAIAYAQTDPVYPSSSSNYFVGGYSGSYRSSTAAEGYLRGMGDVVRSQGQANLDNSAAAINYSHARQSEIQNRREWTETYFAMRETNRRAREAERRPRSTMEQLVRYAQAGKPKPLSPSELDAVTGAIHWPELLQSDEFAANRAKLEEIFAKQSTSGAIGRDNYAEARKVTDAMLADLKKQIRDVSPMQWVAAQKFLKSLAYAAGQPAS